MDYLPEEREAQRDHLETESSQLARFHQPDAWSPRGARCWLVRYRQFSSRQLR